MMELPQIERSLNASLDKLLADMEAGACSSEHPQNEPLHMIGTLFATALSDKPTDYDELLSMLQRVLNQFFVQVMKTDLFRCLIIAPDLPLCISAFYQLNAIGIVLAEHEKYQRAIQRRIKAIRDDPLQRTILEAIGSGAGTFEKIQLAVGLIPLLEIENDDLDFPFPIGPRVLTAEQQIEEKLKILYLSGLVKKAASNHHPEKNTDWSFALTDEGETFLKKL